MPTTANPPRPGTVTSDGVRTISRYLNDPVVVTRALRTLTDRQFVADRVLRGRIVGNMVEYEIGESIFPIGDALPEEIEPFGEFPLVGVGDADVRLEAVPKFGYRTEVSLEAVRRRGDQPVVRANTKLANGVALRFDSAFMAKINVTKASMLAVTGASWSASGATILRQLEQAKAAILDQRQGYNPRAVLLDRQKYAILVSDDKVQNSLDRDTVEDEAFSGTIVRVADLEIMVAPSGTVGATDPIVFDPDALGSIVQDVDAAQRRAGNNGVFAETQYYNSANAVGGAEFWSLSAGREALAIIQEPKSAAVISGTA